MERAIHTECISPFARIPQNVEVQIQDHVNTFFFPRCVPKN